MPRRKSFNEDEVLREIVQLFWRNGYAATAIDQICQHVSLSKPSIYNAYGDKATLFRKVVDWYADETDKQGLAILVGEAPVSEEIAALLRHYLVRPDHDVVSQGCLLTTTMMELQFSEPEIFGYIVKQTEQVRDAIEEYFLTAVRNGRLNRDYDPGALSEYVFTLLQGLRVRSRTSSETGDLDRTITTAMGPLRDAETPDQRTH